jgi:hypothetical protein
MQPYKIKHSDKQKIYEYISKHGTCYNFIHSHQFHLYYNIYLYLNRTLTYVCDYQHLPKQALLLKNIRYHIMIMMI